MTQIRWIRIAISTVVLLLILATVTFWLTKNVELNLEYCAVVFSPDGSSDFIKFGDPRRPKQ